jgi:uncharacterized protein YlxW (UPF0749 family)
MIKYMGIGIIALLMACFVLYSLYDSTKEELSKVKNEKVLLQKEIERRNTNAENLAKKVKVLEKSLEKHSEWSDTRVPESIINSLKK